MDTTHITVSGKRFIIEVHNQRRRCIFIDPERGYLKIATMSVEPALAADYKKLEPMFRTVARLILKKYREQYENFPFEVEYHEAIKLTAPEKERRTGLVLDNRFDAANLRLVPKKATKPKER